jgi:hypothetical protein
MPPYAAKSSAAKSSIEILFDASASAVALRLRLREHAH